MSIDFRKASFKDFENILGMDVYQRAVYFEQYLKFLKNEGIVPVEFDKDGHIRPKVK